jgi:gliding motility-associated lipoprotein GldD
MRRLLTLLLPVLLFGACEESYTPKPYGYFRIDFPAKEWASTPDTLPYRFQMAREAVLEADPAPDAEYAWTNLRYPRYNAKIHLSYKPVLTDTSLANYLNDCHHLAYTHTIKAESINERDFHRKNIFGIIYFIEGNTASSTQFFVTDSTRHFLRGALYFNQHPDKDSLAPVIDHLRHDIIRLMETLRFQ